METVGWIGSILLAICALPEAISAFKRKKTTVPWSLLVPWGLGELFTLVYVISKLDYALIVNYGLNIIFLCVILKYKLVPEVCNG